MPNLKISQLIQRTPDGQEYFEVIIPPFTRGTNRKVLLSNLIPFRGDWSGTTTLPETGGTGAAGSVAAGNEWRLAETLVIGDNVYSPGTIIKAMTNGPGQILSNWAFIATQI